LDAVLREADGYPQDYLNNFGLTKVAAPEKTAQWVSEGVSGSPRTDDLFDATGEWMVALERRRGLHGGWLDSVLDLAAKNHETLLYNRYQTARDNIHRTEPPFAYVISDRQTDVPEDGLLAQKMIDNGLDVYQTKPGFKANGIDYPAGSWVIPMDQPFSPMAKELMERQVYPTAATGETGPGAHLPYDITGWTLPLQLGVAADTITDPMDQSQRSLMTKIDRVKLPEAQVAGTVHSSR